VASKIVNLAAASRQRQTWQKQQQQVVFTNGCFDLLHVGHVRMLQEAAAMGDRLIVAVNSDASVRSLKGSGRPVIDQSGRAEMLAALACVDLVVVFDDHTPVQLLLELRPDVLVKGGTTEVIVGSDIVEAYGGRVGRTSTTANVSTTTLLAAAASKT
jgi:D-beta-D-heptose 7-phosphate kinase/D-beta-D-heptose 1-phosphate adenosyltransferase